MKTRNFTAEDERRARALMANGLRHREIAAELGFAPSTIYEHIGAEQHPDKGRHAPHKSKLTPGRIQQVQAALDNGQTLTDAARQVDVTLQAIIYRIKRGDIKYNRPVRHGEDFYRRLHRRYMSTGETIEQLAGAMGIAKVTIYVGFARWGLPIDKARGIRARTETMRRDANAILPDAAQLAALYRMWLAGARFDEVRAASGVSTIKLRELFDAAGYKRHTAPRPRNEAAISRARKQLYSKCAR